MKFLFIQTNKTLNPLSPQNQWRNIFILHWCKNPFHFLMAIYFFLKQEPPISQFWMTYALYNVGSKIKPFNPTLYSNSQPHSPKPNFYWSQILKEILKINISPDRFETLTFKSLYLLIVNSDSNPISSLPDPLNTKPTPFSHTWPRLFLLKLF